MAAQSHSTSEEHRLHNFTFVNRFVCFYFPVVRLMAVEDELRGGAIPDIKPRILTDQVCACVYTTSHVLNKFASLLHHVQEHFLLKPAQVETFAAATPVTSIVQSTLFVALKSNISPHLAHTWWG
ncbi:hypothetical protein AMECASPLE_011212 [Ameca splendens]|uniref:Uncharacterized protein n=1 Tax=Ameca splendens TaxID=208324 RepID=A0ABV0YZS2_9TELE